MQKSVTIIGHGYVGQGMQKIFPDAIVYDEPKGIGSPAEANSAELAIICVQTPMNNDGSCDTHIVEEVVSWLETPLILIKSTVAPGTTDYLKGRYRKRICVSPEYMGEGKYFIPYWKYPHPSDPTYHDWFIVGGAQQDAEEILGYFLPILGPDKFYYIVEAVEAELIKYMENTWIAAKVTFANEFFEICKAFNASYTKVREGFLLDGRVERNHTVVFPKKRGFDGRCLPKDLSAIIKAAEKAGYDPAFLKAIIASNKMFQS